MFHNQTRPCELSHVNLRKSSSKSRSDDCYIDLKLRTVLHDDDLAALHLDPEGFGQFAEQLTGRANLGRHNVAISGNDWVLHGHEVFLSKPVLQSKPVEPLTATAERDKTSRHEVGAQILPGMPAPPPPPQTQYEVTLTFSLSIPIIGKWKGYAGMHRSIGGVIDVEFEESDRALEVAEGAVCAAGITTLVVMDEGDGQARMETALSRIADFFVRWKRADESAAEAVARWMECGGTSDDDGGGAPHAVALFDVPLHVITDEMLDDADLATLRRWYERLAGKTTEATSEVLVRDMTRRRLAELREEEAWEARQEIRGDDEENDEPSSPYAN